MALNIHTNVSSLTAQRYLGRTQNSLTQSIGRLSSGYRINSARDDAAGLAISEGMRARLQSLQQAGRNANDAISLTQVAESSMGDISNVLVRMRQLAVQASSGSITNDQRSLLDEEFQELSAEIGRIVEKTSYNGTTLLSGALAGANAAIFMIGAEKGDTISVAIGNLNTAATATGVLVSGDVTTSANAGTALDTIDDALDNLNNERAKLGGMQTRLDLIADNIQVQHENLSAANARIREVDFAMEMANFTKQQILMQAGTSMLSQANLQPQMILQLLS